jgi:hypothetical protein
MLIIEIIKSSIQYYNASRLTTPFFETPKDVFRVGCVLAWCWTSTIFEKNDCPLLIVSNLKEVLC